MAWTCAGYHPITHEPRIATINIPTEAKDEVETTLRSDGWTDLIWSSDIRDRMTHGEPEASDRES